MGLSYTRSSMKHGLDGNRITFAVAILAIVVRGKQRRRLNAA